jgi:hypothetical protein
VKLHQYEDRVFFYCPGCKHGHSYIVPRWQFNGDFDKPTFSPSLLNFITHEDGRRETICHLFVRDGKIEFCSDCPHELAGQTVDLPDFPEGYGLPGVSA